MPMGNGARRTPSRPTGARAQLAPADDGGPSGAPLPPLAFVPPGALSCKTDVDEIERGLRPQAAKLSESELTVRVAVGRLELGITACTVPHATYLLVVASGGELWCVRRRFRDFLLLEAAIASGGTPRPEALTRLAALPALKRTLLGPLSALSVAFRRRRAAALEAYLHAAAASALLRLAHLAAFLGLDIYHPSRRPSLLREPRSWTDPAASKSGSPLGSCSSSYSSLSSPDARAVPRALSGPRTIRVLCLHGRGSNPQVLTRQLDALRAEVPDLSLYTLLAAPLRAKRATQPDSNGAAAPFFEWWQCPANQPPSAVAPMANSAAAAEQLMLEGLEASARAVVECVIRHGPFDAVLGFSQAQILEMPAEIAAAAGAYNLPRAWELPCLWRAAVLVCGFAPVGPRLASLFTPPLPLPSFHVIGKTDPIADRSEALALGCYERETQRVHYSNGGHRFPDGPEAYRELGRWLARTFAPGA